LLQRCSRPLCSSQITGGAIERICACPSTGNGRGGSSQGRWPTRESITRSLRTQQCARRAPRRLLGFPRRRTDSTHEVLPQNQPNSRRSTSKHRLCAERTSTSTDCWTPRVTTDCQMLLRKEVIQPHLPVRLPCYDFVPIASPTFDGSLHKGWATGFGCCRLS
jgi:hypothetical protein